MKNMKKIVAALLVLTMVLALTGTAMAACKFKKGDYVEFKADANGYSDHHSNKKTSTVIKAGSIAQVVCTSGDNWVKLKLTPTGNKVLWFQVKNLKCAKASPMNDDGVYCIFIYGGTNQSKPVGEEVEWKPGYTLKVTGKINLRKGPSLQCAKQEVVKKGDVLKYKGKAAIDNRGVVFYKVCYKGNIRWISSEFAKLCKKK